MNDKPLTAKQHFVPQFYLRNFADSDGMLHIFNARERRRAKPRSASGVCYDHFFYAEETGKPDEISQEVENFFAAHIEDPLSKEVPEILGKLEYNQQVSNSERYTLAIFMNTMWLRNPAMRQQINNMQDQMLRWVAKMQFSRPNIDQELDSLAQEQGPELSGDEREAMKRMVLDEEYRLEFSNQAHLRFMLDDEHLRGFANLFCGQYWTVHISKCDRQFVTSDNPVAVILPPREGVYGPTFLERTHIFPLTPTLAIEATYPRQEGGKKLRRKTHFKGNEKEVDRINLQLASQAGYLYASRPDEIEWFEKYVELVKKLEKQQSQSMVAGPKEE